MANLNAPAFNYAPRSTREKWANGFAVVINNHVDKVSVQLIEPVSDHFYYGGMLY
jgi:hypothetical protein